MAVAVTREQAQATITDALAERDAIQANLLDLDGSFGKRLLAGAALTGASRQQWDTASAGLAVLWDKFSAYSAVLDRAAEILGASGRLHPARLEEAVGLLHGPSVLVDRSVSALSQRELTAGARRRLTPASAVAEMKHEFPPVAAVFSAAEAVWNEIADGMREVTESLDRAGSQAPLLADAEVDSALAAAGANLRALRDAVNSDPLAFWQAGQVVTSRLDRLRQAAAAVTGRAEQLDRVRQNADRRIAEVTATVAAATRARQDAAEARDRAAARITAVPAGPLPDVGALSGRLSGLAALKAAGRWTRLASDLEIVAGQAEAARKQCQEAERSAAGLVDTRNELRGLLDGYRAKAASRGGAEDADLAARYRRARELLWTAPCDLTAAQAAVTDYQQAVLHMRRSGERT